MWANAYLLFFILVILVGIPTAIIVGLLKLSGRTTAQAEKEAPQLFFVFLLVVITLIGGVAN